MKKEYSFPADITNLDKVEKCINSILDYEEVDERLFGNVLIAVTEGFTNAVVHGSQNDNSKEVKIAYTSSNKDLAFSIKDQGSGFNYKDIPDPTKPENLEKPNGRGVFLISSLSDELKFEQNGSLLEMKFNLEVK